MSTICSKCNSILPPDSTVCPVCGAPVVASAAAAVPPTPPVAYSAGPVTVPPPVTTGGGGALKIILIVVGVFVLIGVIAACVIGYGVYRVSKAVHVDKNGAGMTIDTPTGKISAGSDSSVGAAELGVDVYPGAVHGPGSLNLKSPDGAMTTANFMTSDSVSQVVDFYKAKLGVNATTMETSSGTILTSDNSNPNENIVVSVTSDDGKTKIGIVHSTKNK